MHMENSRNAVYERKNYLANHRGGESAQKSGSYWRSIAAVEELLTFMFSLTVLHPLSSLSEDGILTDVWQRR